MLVIRDDYSKLPITTPYRKPGRRDMPELPYNQLFTIRSEQPSDLGRRLPRACAAKLVSRTSRKGEMTRSFLRTSWPW